MRRIAPQRAQHVSRMTGESHQSLDLPAARARRYAESIAAFFLRFLSRCLKPIGASFVAQCGRRGERPSCE